MGGWGPFSLCAEHGYQNSLDDGSAMPILMHHTPQHHTSHITSLEGGSYYRTTGTSPLINLGTPAHSSTVLSNGSRPFDDLESDDDLDREDITFPSDAGNGLQLRK